MRYSRQNYHQSPEYDQVKVAVYAEAMTEGQTAQQRLQERVWAAGIVALALTGLALLH